MDIVSHGLWGGVAFGRKNKRNFGIAFFVGMMPDLLSFGIYFITNLLGITEHPKIGHPDPASIPHFIYQLYDISHSLIVFAVVFGLVWFFRKKPQWLLGAWLLHILVDIPTHSFEFFPTPLFWPVSDFKVNGINWGDPIIFFPNLFLLFVFYSAWYFKSRKLKEKI